MLSRTSYKRFNPCGVEYGKVVESEESKAFWRQIDTRKFPRHKDPGIDLKRQHRKSMEIATIISLFLVLVFFQGIRRAAIRSQDFDQTVAMIEVEQIPITKQFRRPPPPSRPPVPIPSENEDIPEEDTIGMTDLDLASMPPPPVAPEPTDDASDIFVAYDVPPKPIGGWASLYKRLIYPEVAAKAGIEGRVIIKVLVDEQGKVLDAKILKSSGSDVGFEEAALVAARTIKWIPAQQRDLAVKVWVSVPIVFQLRS